MIFFSPEARQDLFFISPDCPLFWPFCFHLFWPATSAETLDRAEALKREQPLRSARSIAAMLTLDNTNPIAEARLAPRTLRRHLAQRGATTTQLLLSHIASIEEAHITLEPLLGTAARWIFAVSLLASGLSSSAVGTMAGQVIMQGFLERHIPIWLRRLVTILPALVVIFLGFDPTWTLVISQVVLSFGLPLAVIPLVLFSQRRDLMAELVNKPLTTVLAWAVAGLIIALNLYLLHQTLF